MSLRDLWNRARGAYMEEDAIFNNEQLARDIIDMVYRLEFHPETLDIDITLLKIKRDTEQQVAIAHGGQPGFLGRVKFEENIEGFVNTLMTDSNERIKYLKRHRPLLNINWRQAGWYKFPNQASPNYTNLERIDQKTRDMLTLMIYDMNNEGSTPLAVYDQYWQSVSLGDFERAHAGDEKYLSQQYFYFIHQTNNDDELIIVNIPIHDCSAYGPVMYGRTSYWPNMIRILQLSPARFRQIQADAGILGSIDILPYVNEAYVRVKGPFDSKLLFRNQDNQ